MNIAEAIQALVQDPKFEAVEALFDQQKKAYQEAASESKGTIEERAINNITNAAKAEACDELLELLSDTAAKRVKDKLKKNDE